MPQVHIVRTGECLGGIATRYGYGARALYEHPANSALRKQRPDPNVLHPGDHVVIPEVMPRLERAAVDKRHAFVMASVRRMLRVRLFGDDGAPLRNAGYLFSFSNTQRKGRTNPEGMLIEQVPAHVTMVHVETAAFILELALGELNPLSDVDDGGVSGAQARLRNLGYRVGKLDGLLGPRTRAAIQAFQHEHGLAVTGDLDPQTCDALRRAHGG